ncbi:hypothetical protein [Arthrobacter sp. B3I4]|uniref:hypothetical protein n=1 Tax=Arthrobacter sp. B3I4 TaxID=3042267 RepID=UPI002787DC35|nr:hypothetical protein [Arthrobacter sp. B3I4]MDQ0755673.1 hypothetical protein [Arthrobacter sp. B3I4]
MSEIPAGGGPDPDAADIKGKGQGKGLDADAFSPVIDPDLVPAETPADDEAKRAAEPSSPDLEDRPGD